MPTGVENILGYKGDAAQGIGANAKGWTIDPTQQLSVIQKTANDIMLLDSQRAVKMFEQKVKDRDDLYRLLENGQVQAGDIDPKYRSEFDKAEKESKDAFLKIKGANDDEGRMNYLSKVRALKDVTTHAQSKTLEKAKLEQELAKQTSPAMIKAYEKHIKGQEDKPFWDMYDPFHPTPQYNMDFIKLGLDGSVSGTGISAPTATTSKTTQTTKDGKTSTTQTQTSAPVKGKGVQPVMTGETQTGTDALGRTITSSETKVDYGKIQDNIAKLYLSNPDQRYNMEETFKKIQQDPTAGKDVIEHMQQRFAEYNKENGFDENNPNALKFTVGVDKNNSIVEMRGVNGELVGYHINMPIPKFAAMMTLAEHPGKYVERSAQWDKDYDMYKLALKKEKDANEIGWARINETRRLNNAKIAKLKTEGEQDQAMAQLWDNNHAEQKNFINLTPGNISPTGSAFVESKIPANKSLPIYTIGKEGKPEILIPKGATIIKNKAGNIISYEGGSYDIKYVDKSGNPIEGNTLEKLYNNYSALETNPYKKLSFENYVKEIVKRGNIDYRIEGENGATDRQTAFSAQKIISNKTTKKGETSAFTPVEDEEPE